MKSGLRKYFRVIQSLCYVFTTKCKSTSSKMYIFHLFRFIVFRNSAMFIRIFSILISLADCRLPQVLDHQFKKSTQAFTFRLREKFRFFIKIKPPISNEIVVRHPRMPCFYHRYQKNREYVLIKSVCVFEFRHSFKFQKRRTIKVQLVDSIQKYMLTSKFINVVHITTI